MPEASNWHAADKAYQAHHIGCTQCIAAGINRSSQVRCPDGQALWDAYCSAGLPSWLAGDQSRARAAPAPLPSNRPAVRGPHQYRAP